MQDLTTERQRKFRSVKRLTRQNQHAPILVRQSILRESLEKTVVQPVKFIACHGISERTESRADLMQPSGRRTSLH